MSNKLVSLREIEQAAHQHLSSYSGGEHYEYSGGDQYEYTGFGDEFVDFGGDGITFANEIAAGRQFTYTISNANASAQSVLLVPSYAPSNTARVIREGAIPYTSSATDLTAAGAPQSIDNFLSWISQNPTRVMGFKITSNNSLTLAQSMQLQRKSPFRVLENETIALGNFTTEFASNDKMATIKRQLQFDNQTELSMIVPARVDSSTPTTVTITWFVGAILNQSKALSKKHSAALQVPQVRTNQVMMSGGGVNAAITAPGV